MIKKNFFFLIILGIISASIRRDEKMRIDCFSLEPIKRSARPPALDNDPDHMNPCVGAGITCNTCKIIHPELFGMIPSERVHFGVKQDVKLEARGPDPARRVISFGPRKQIACVKTCTGFAKMCIEMSKFVTCNQ